MNIRHGYLYLADLNPRVGTKPGKLRPVLVIQTDLVNEAHHPSTWIIPCTSRIAGPNLLRVFLPAGIAGNITSCDIMIDQSCSIDNRRFKKELKALPSKLLQEVKEKLRLFGEMDA